MPKELDYKDLELFIRGKVDKDGYSKRGVDAAEARILKSFGDVDTHCPLVTFVDGTCCVVDVGGDFDNSLFLRYPMAADFVDSDVVTVTRDQMDAIYDALGPTGS